MEWTTVKVPKQVLPKLAELRSRTGKPNWQIIVEAISFYESYLRHYRHYSNTNDIDKIAYYIMKLVTSASYFKFSTTEESLEKFKQVLSQLKERLGIDCEEVVPAAEKLLKQNTGKNIHTFNMSIKSCIIKLISKLMEA